MTNGGLTLETLDRMWVGRHHRALWVVKKFGWCLSHETPLHLIMSAITVSSKLFTIVGCVNFHEAVTSTSSFADWFHCRRSWHAVGIPYHQCGLKICLLCWGHIYNERIVHKCSCISVTKASEIKFWTYEVQNARLDTWSILDDLILIFAWYCAAVIVTVNTSSFFLQCVVV